MNADFLSACEAEMKALVERPELAAGSYGGPLLITKVETAAVEPGIESYTPAIERTEDSAPLHEAAYRAEVDTDVTERTPDNYPAADEVQVGRGTDGTPIAF